MVLLVFLCEPVHSTTHGGRPGRSSTASSHTKTRYKMNPNSYITTHRQKKLHLVSYFLSCAYFLPRSLSLCVYSISCLCSDFPREFQLPVNGNVFVFPGLQVTKICCLKSVLIFFASLMSFYVCCFVELNLFPSLSGITFACCVRCCVMWHLLHLRNSMWIPMLFPIFCTNHSSIQFPGLNFFFLFKVIFQNQQHCQ